MNTQDLELPEQNCPLCKRIAQYKGVHFGRNIYFICPKCKDFVIPRYTEKLVAGLKQEIREHFSRQSSALRDDSVLVIYATDPVDDTSTWKASPEPRDKWFEFRIRNNSACKA